jgi:quercetin dioxygenase-like cupin family protein
VDVTAATGISTSFLSLVESGKNDLTISRLVRLCAFYGVGVAELLSSTLDGGLPGWRPGEERRRFLSPAEGIEVELLAPEGATQMEVALLDVAPGGGFAEPVSAAVEVFLVVLEGRIEVALDEREPAVLACGDTLYLTRGRRHSYRNPDRGRAARAIVVVSPPLAR